MRLFVSVYYDKDGSCEYKHILGIYDTEQMAVDKLTLALLTMEGTRKDLWGEVFQTEINSEELLRIHKFGIRYNAEVYEIRR